MLVNMVADYGWHITMSILTLINVLLLDADYEYNMVIWHKRHIYFAKYAYNLATNIMKINVKNGCMYVLTLQMLID
jgi:hypothetical protein